MFRVLALRQACIIIHYVTLKCYIISRIGFSLNGQPNLQLGYEQSQTVWSEDGKVTERQIYWA